MTGSRGGGDARNEAARIVVGVDTDVIKHVLGNWVQTTEGAKFCGGVARSSPIAVCVGLCDQVLRRLTGFPQAIAATRPEANQTGGRRIR